MVSVSLTVVFSACHQPWAHPWVSHLCWETYEQVTMVIGNLEWLVNWTVEVSLPLIPLLWHLLWGVNQTDGLGLVDSSLFDLSTASNLSVSFSSVPYGLIVQLPWIELGCWVIFYILFGQIPSVNYVMLDDAVQNDKWLKNVPYK